MTDEKSIIIEPERRVAIPSIKEVFEKREVLWIMMVAAIQTRYRQTTLGVVWSVLQPTLFMLVLTLIFGILVRINVGDTPYALFVLVGLMPWQFFSRLLMDMTHSLVGISGILRKIYIPRLLLVLVPVGPAFVDFIVGMVVVVALFFYYDYSVGVHILTLPMFIILNITLALSLGLWVSVFNVLYRDVGVVLPIALQVVFYMTPVIYPVTMVPERFQPLYWLNPTSVIVQGYRYAFLGDISVPTDSIILASLVTLVVAVSGLFVFNRVSQNMVDKL